MTHKGCIGSVALVTLMVVAPAAPVAAGPVETPVLSAPEIAQYAFARLRQRHPDRFRQAVEAARLRGWKPTDHYEGWAIPGRPGHPRKEPVAWFSPQQDYASGWEGEAAVWYWEDGNGWTVEYQMYVRGYTGEDVWVEGQFVPTSTNDGYHAWFEFLGGSRYARERGTRAELLLVQISSQKKRCLRDCLRGKVERVLRSTSRAAGTSLVACTPAAATGGGPALYMGCVGGGSLGSLLFNLVDEFIFQDDCELQCGVTGGGGGWEDALCRIG